MEVTIGCTVGCEGRPAVGEGAMVGEGAGEGQKAAPDMSVFDMDDPRQLGMMGEELAAFYMEENGYTVCERNYRTPHGEADMVCRKGDETVLVEVKTRRETRRIPRRPSTVARCDVTGG